LSSPNAFTIYRLVGGNAMLLTDSGVQDSDRFNHRSSGRDSISLLSALKYAK
jgi:hypothetical protein